MSAQCHVQAAAPVKRKAVSPVMTEEDRHRAELIHKYNVRRMYVMRYGHNVAMQESRRPKSLMELHTEKKDKEVGLLPLGIICVTCVQAEASRAAGAPQRKAFDYETEMKTKFDG